MYISRTERFSSSPALNEMRVMLNFGGISCKKVSEAFVFLSADSLGNLGLTSLGTYAASTSSKEPVLTLGTRDASINCCQMD